MLRSTEMKRAAPIKRRGKRKASDEKNRSEPWLDAVRAIPHCMLCGKFRPVQAAHMNEGKGFALKVPDCFTAALCEPCHFDIDNGNELDLGQRRARMKRADRRTLTYLFQNGVIGVL